MAWLSGIKRAFHRPSDEERRRAERRAATGLTARYGAGPASASAPIEDISAYGIHLQMLERPPVGGQLTLILGRQGEPDDSELQISVQTEVMTHGEDGIGLMFVLPAGMGVDLWGVLIRQIVTLTDPVQIAEMFRSLRTILFLCRLCGAEAADAIQLLNGQLDADHTEVFFKIALSAERQLAADADAPSLRGNGKLVASILREGCWASDDLIKELWTGLLVSSCSVDVPDDSNQVLVELLVHVTTVEAKILAYACDRVLGSAHADENSGPASVILGPEEIVRVTGVHDLRRNATDLGYLFNLGLIEKVLDFSSYSHADRFDITPSPLGMTLYKHCRGQREKLEPQLVELAREYLANFLPAPRIAAEINASPAEPSSGS